MSREIALWTTSTGPAAADFHAAVILCSLSQRCSKFVLGETVMFEQLWKKPWRLRTAALPIRKALSISLADRHWLTNLPGKIFSAFMKFGGIGARMSKRIAFKQTDTQTHTDTDTQTHRHT